MNTQSRSGRPKKLVSTRIYLSADTEAEHSFILALLERKQTDSSFNIGSYLLEMTMKYVSNPPNGVLSLSDDSLEKLSSKLISGLSHHFNDLNILSGIASIVSESGKGSALNPHFPSINSDESLDTVSDLNSIDLETDNAIMEEGQSPEDDEVHIDIGIQELKKGKAFF